MARDALLRRHSIYAAAAVIAAHAASRSEGFRQRDVRFLIELFSNWLLYSIAEESLNLSNMQVRRYLEELVDEGMAKRKKSGGQPYYRLTRVGVIELLRSLVVQPFYKRPSRFFFLYYFLSNYRSQISSLVEREGAMFPPTLRLELEPLLDPERLRQNQLEAAQQEVRKLTIRMRDSDSMSKLSKQMFKEGYSLEAVVAAVEQQYPYELNSQKPLSELIGELEAEQAIWELQHGGEQRSLQIWTPLYALWQSYIKALEELSPSRRL